MNPLGILSNVYGAVPVEEVARRARADGFAAVHFDPVLHGVAVDGPGAAGAARAARRALEDQGLTVAALAGYTNLVDPDPERRARGLRRFESLLDVCHEFGTPYVATETGSLHPSSPWEDYAANHTPAARAELLEVLRRLLERARARGATILIEGYVNNVVATTEEASALIADLGGEGLGFVLDPFNYFTREDVERPRAALERIFAAVARRAPIAHAKDVVYGPKGIDTPRAGQGRMEWAAYADMLRRHAPTIPLLLEHLRPEQVAECRAFVERVFAAGA